MKLKEHTIFNHVSSYMNSSIILLPCPPHSNSSLSTHVTRHHNTTLTALHKEESEAQEQQGLAEHSVYREGQRGRPPKFS